MSNCAGPIVLGELHPGRLQTRSVGTPPAACAVKAIDPPSGDTATLKPSVSFVGEPPSIDTIQIDTVPPSERGEQHVPIVGRDGHGLAVTEGTNRVFRRPFASAVQRSRVLSVDDTNTIVRPSLVAAGARASRTTSSGVFWPGVTFRIAGFPPTMPAYSSRSPAHATRSTPIGEGTRCTTSAPVAAPPSPTHRSMRASRRPVTRRRRSPLRLTPT